LFPALKNLNIEDPRPPILRTLDISEDLRVQDAKEVYRKKVFSSLLKNSTELEDT
jgi:hypothetical protein